MKARAVATALIAGLTGCIAIDLYLVLWHGLVVRDAGPLTISQWDASTALGAAAFDGGVATALLGLGLHAVVSTVWGFVYTAAALRLPALVEAPWAAGACFGVAVYVVMRYAVLPFAHASLGHGKPTPAGLASVLAAHIIGFGWPVAFVVAARLSGGSSPVRASA